MRLIALRDFRNHAQLDLNADGKYDPIFEAHVHKGARFNIGGTAPFDKLSKADQKTVFDLNAAGCIGDAENEKLVKRIEAEAKADEEAAKKAAAAHAAGGDAHLAKIVAAVLAQLKAKPAATA